MEILNRQARENGGFDIAYKATSIQDLIEHEYEIISNARQSYEQTHQPTLSMRGLVRKSFSSLWRINQLMDPGLEPFYYEVAFIYIPRVRHDKDQDLHPQARGMTLYDAVQIGITSHMEIYPPKPEDSRWLKEVGHELDFVGLKRSTWSSPVVLKAFLTPMREDRYTLFRVFNRYAIEKQEEAALSFFKQFGFQQA